MEDHRARAQHFATLDGLRAIAALVVVFDHYSKDVNLLGHIGAFSGQLGVMLFFCLSGFLMMHVTAETPPTWQNIRLFLSRRLNRVLPLFAVIVTLAYVLQKAGRAADIPSSYLAFNLLHEFPAYLQNLLLIRGDEIFWTIGIEVAFYAIFPLFWMARCRSNLTIMGLILVAFLMQVLTQFQWSSDFAPTRINRCGQLFLAGMLAYTIHQYNFWNRQHNQLADFLFVVASCLFFLSFPQISQAIFQSNLEQSKPHSVWQNPVHWAIMALLVMTAPQSSLAKGLLANRFMVFIGTISFSIYLTHRFILRAALAIPFDNNIEKFALLIFVLMTIILFISWLRYNHIEKPAREYLNKRAVFSIRGQGSAQTHPPA
jgi:peptidoglycan/LPS O-acetylase OafA/YrhL